MKRGKNKADIFLLSFFDHKFKTLETFQPI